MNGIIWLIKKTEYPGLFSRVLKLIWLYSKWFQAKIDDTNVFQPMTVDMRIYRFYFGEEDSDETIYNALAPRVGKNTETLGSPTWNYL